MRKALLAGGEMALNTIVFALLIVLGFEIANNLSFLWFAAYLASLSWFTPLWRSHDEDVEE